MISSLLVAIEHLWSYQYDKYFTYSWRLAESSRHLQDVRHGDIKADVGDVLTQYPSRISTVSTPHNHAASYAVLPSRRNPRQNPPDLGRQGS